MNPRVSVIVPVHNAAETLRRCVESVLTQTVRDLEVVLVDDGSTDTSPALCEEFARRDARVASVHQGQGGVSSARNVGLRMARGEFVAFLDADDWAEDTMLERLLAVAEETASDVVVSGCLVVIEDHRGQVVSERRLVPPSAVIDETTTSPAMTISLVNLIGYCWNKLYRRSLLREGSIEFPENMSVYEDLVFSATALRGSRRTAFVEQTPVRYMQRPETSLGSRPHDDLLAARQCSLRALADLLVAWDVPERQRVALVSALGTIALRTWAGRLVERRSMSLLQATRQFAVSRPDVDGLISVSTLRPARRVEFWMLRHLPAAGVMFAFWSRHRLHVWRGSR